MKSALCAGRLISGTNVPVADLYESFHAHFPSSLPRVSHVHVKDVSESLAKAVRGGMTGIAVSHCALGDGVNAGNIKQCLGVLRDTGYQGVLSMECEGAGGPMIEKSLGWLRQTLKELNIREG